MTRSEVANLFSKIVMYFPSFTGDIEKVKAWHEVLEKVPFDLAVANLKRHAAEEKFPPTIAELSRPIEHPKSDAEKFHEYMRNAGIHTIEEWEQMRIKAVPPTPEQRERVKRYASRV